MAKKVTEKVAQFGVKGYGFITGDDSERYFVHQKKIFNKFRIKVGTRVVFNTANSEKGWVVTEVDLANSARYLLNLGRYQTMRLKGFLRFYLSYNLY